MTRSIFTYKFVSNMSNVNIHISPISWDVALGYQLINLSSHMVLRCMYNIGFPGQFRRFVIPFDGGVIQIREINLGHEIRSSNLYFGH